jgi:hypothetical protein
MKNVHQKGLVSAWPVALLVTLGALCAQQAFAGCGQIQSPSKAQDPNSHAATVAGFRFRPAAFTQTEETDDTVEAIVGLWRFKFLSKGSVGIPDGAVIDNGLVTWHGDKTEITNSSREPITGNFCMGVWKKTGVSTYHLNHIGLSWDGTGTVFVGPASIKQTVTVDPSGKTYSGTFSITQYAIDEKTVLAIVKGVTTGDRVTAD